MEAGYSGLQALADIVRYVCTAAVLIVIFYTVRPARSDDGGE